MNEKGREVLEQACNIIQFGVIAIICLFVLSVILGCITASVPETQDDNRFEKMKEITVNTHNELTYRDKETGHEYVIIEDKFTGAAGTIQISAEEFELACKVIAAEARGESLEGQIAVAQVIKNRMEQSGESLSTVVSKPYQFAKPYDGEISESVYKAANKVFRQDCTVFDEPVTFFHNDSVTPAWSHEKQFVGKIGAHLFYIG